MEYLYIMDKDGNTIKEYEGSVELFTTHSIFRTNDGHELPHFGKTSIFEGEVSWDNVWFKEQKGETQIRDAFRLGYEKELRYATNRVLSLTNKIGNIENSEIKRRVKNDY